MNVLPIETLKDIVQQCQYNEERLRHLARRTRHERKKIQRFLRENQFSQTKNKDISIDRPTTRRVRFNLDGNQTYDDEDYSMSSRTTPIIHHDDELEDLARRCETLLTQIQQSKTTIKPIESFDRHDINDKLLHVRLRQQALLRH